MPRHVRLLGSLLVLLMLLTACGEAEDSAGGDTPATATVVAATATAEATPTSTAALTTPTLEPSATPSPVPTSTPEPIATAVAEPTATPTSEPEPTATPEPPPSDGPTHEWVTAWDAKWETLGVMNLGPDGLLYVDDFVRKRLMVFGTDGSEHPPLEYTSDLPEFVQLRNDFGLAPDGRIFLLEQSGTAMVQVYDADGTLVTKWGGTVGFEPDSLFDARTIAVAPDGHLFTSRPGVLQKFTYDGEFVSAWDYAGEYLFPMEVWDMDVVGDLLYVAATGYRDHQNVILTFDFDGNLTTEPLVIGERDAGDRIFPGSLAVGPDGNLFVADPFTREIVVLTSAGEVLTRWSLEETSQRFPPIEVAIGDAGRVYVADGGRKLIAVYASSSS